MLPGLLPGSDGFTFNLRLAMKLLLRILAILVAGLLVLVLGFAGYANWKFATRKPQPVRPLEIRAVADSAVIADGMSIASTLCAGCHLGPEGTLSGSLFTDSTEGFGNIWSANLTRHPDAPLARYSDGELAFTIRSGISREGRILGPFMAHPLFADEDLTAVISFLRSSHPLTDPSPARRPLPDYSFLAKTVIGIGIYDPLPLQEQPLHVPDPGDQIAYGRYLATIRYTCSNCHSASFETNDLLEPERSKGFFGGGNPVKDARHTVVTVSPNLTPHPADGIGGWTREAFVQAVRYGTAPGQRALSPAMPRFALADSAELAAIWAYLQTLPPLEGN